MHAGHCELCGDPFVKTRAARFCNRACRQAAYRDRHRAEGEPPTVRANRRPRKTDPPTQRATMTP
jgi:hypothetical protein